jgi:hypothetical protein
MWRNRTAGRARAPQQIVAQRPAPTRIPPAGSRARRACLRARAAVGVVADLVAAWDEHRDARIVFDIRPKPPDFGAARALHLRNQLPDAQNRAR